jgi:hypothetical protein
MSKLYTRAVLPPAFEIRPIPERGSDPLDPLYPRRTICERRIDAGLPQIGRLNTEGSDESREHQG